MVSTKTELKSSISMQVNGLTLEMDFASGALTSKKKRKAQNPHDSDWQNVSLRRRFNRDKLRRCSSSRICRESPATFHPFPMIVCVTWLFTAFLLPFRHLFLLSTDTAMMDSKQECLIFFFFSSWSQESASTSLKSTKLLFYDGIYFKLVIIFDFLMARHVFFMKLYRHTNILLPKWVARVN